MGELRWDIEEIPVRCDRILDERMVIWSGIPRAGFRDEGEPQGLHSVIRAFFNHLNAQKIVKRPKVFKSKTKTQALNDLSNKRNIIHVD